MTQFVTSRGEVLNVTHGQVQVVAKWTSETPKRPKYHFSWEHGPDAGCCPQPCDCDPNLPQLEDGPNEEAERLYREEYQEQFED
jgi:hypothetical protein